MSATDRSNAAAVLLTGAYGTGKTSLVEEIADILEAGEVAYGAIDLDWLGWYDVGGDDHHRHDPVGLKNLEAIAGNYYDAGVRRFALAGTAETVAEIEGLRSALAMPLTVVRLHVPLEEIERRLSASVTAGRQDDLRAARESIAAGRGQDVGDHVIVNEGPIRDVAMRVLSTLEWP